MQLHIFDGFLKRNTIFGIAEGVSGGFCGSLAGRSCGTATSGTAPGSGSSPGGRGPFDDVAPACGTPSSGGGSARTRSGETTGTEGTSLGEPAPDIT